MSVEKQIRLYYTNTQHDKEYMLRLNDLSTRTSPLYVVTAYWGPRGCLSSSQEKYRGLNHEAANATFEQVLAEKTKKGYTTDPTGRPGSFVEAEIDAVLADIDGGGITMNLRSAKEEEIDRAIEEGRNERV